MNRAPEKPGAVQNVDQRCQQALVTEPGDLLQRRHFDVLEALPRSISGGSPRAFIFRITVSVIELSSASPSLQANGAAPADAERPVYRKG
jgi:hypothetical protein